MSEKSINKVFAENLDALMKRKGFNQVSLAAKSKVSQKTISNCLNPTNRTTGSRGKEASVKLTEMQMLSAALDAEPWQLLRPLDPQQREAYEKIELAFKVLQDAGVLNPGVLSDGPSVKRPSAKKVVTALPKHKSLAKTGAARAA